VVREEASNQPLASTAAIPKQVPSLRVGGPHECKPKHGTSHEMVWHKGDTATTEKSNQFQGSETNSQNNVATMFNKSSSVNIHLKTSPRGQQPLTIQASIGRHSPR